MPGAIKKQRPGKGCQAPPIYARMHDGLCCTLLLTPFFNTSAFFKPMACVTLTPFFNANADNCLLQGLAMACVTTVAGCGQNLCFLKYERMNFFMTSTRLSNCDALCR